MTTIQMVKDGYARLESEFEHAKARAGIKRSTVFYEWAGGKILLNAKQTEEARLEQNEGNVVFVLDAVQDIFAELAVRNSAALTHDKQGDYVIILVSTS